MLGIGFKRFAPNADQVLVPVTSRGAALAGIAFYPAYGRKSARAQKMAWRATSLLGPRALPGRMVQWDPPMETGEWNRLVGKWRSVVGDVDAVAVLARQGEEAALRLLLLLEGEPVAHAKLRPAEEPSLAHEERVLALLSESRPRSFRAPGVLARGEEAGWGYLLTRALRPRIHRMVPDPPLARVADEIHIGLSRLPRRPATPNHWQPMHGELAPWTLRETDEGDLVLTDWERARWGPPGADEVFYRAAVTAVSGGSPGPIHVREALEFWREQFMEGGMPSHLGPGFLRRMLRAFNLMGGNAADL
jgi:hypothetical protein